ncbi:MAG: FecR domain-containing protein [Acidobacteria bacterium]|nr:FecR domain-containing protein [Acidobacteriota bacterium]
MSTPKNRRGFTEEWFIIQKKTINKILLSILAVFLLATGGYAFKVYILPKIIPPPLPAPEKAARFANIEGNVSVKRKGVANFETASLNMALNEGDTIQTGSGARAVIVYEDATRYTLKPESTLIIRESARQQKRVVNDLEGGGVNVSTNKDSDKHIIKSGDVKVGVSESTDSTINNQGNKTTVVVTGGLATLFFGDGKEQNVAQDQVAEIEKTDVKLSELPPPPKLSQPESAKELVIDKSKLEVEFVWAPIANAQGYILEVSSTVAFADQAIKLRASDIKENRYKWIKPRQGPVFWRVRAITKNQIETKWSEPYSVRINIKGEPIPIELTKRKEVAPSLWELEGNTAPGARLRINNQQVTVDSNGHFKKDLPLPANQKQIVLEAFDPAGNIGRLVVNL